MLVIYPTIEELKNDSFKVTTSTIITIIDTKEKNYRKTINLDWIEQLNSFYSVQGNTIAFVHSNNLYVTPYTTVAIDCLQRSNFVNTSFYVPFSDGGYPLNQYEKWENLLIRASNLKHDILNYHIQQWFEHHNLTELSEMFLSKWIKLPNEGTYVQHIDSPGSYTSWLYPIIKPTDLFGPDVIDKLGRYYINGEIIAFHYLDGSTYVTYGYNKVYELEAYGYKEGNFPYQLFNGDIFLLEPYRNVWFELIHDYYNH